MISSLEVGSLFEVVAEVSPTLIKIVDGLKCFAGHNVERQPCRDVEPLHPRHARWRGRGEGARPSL